MARSPRGRRALAPRRASPSRAAREIGASLRRYREAQEIAGSWIAELARNPDTEVGRLLAEMLKVVAFQTLAALGAAEEQGEVPMALSLVARAIKDLEGAAKLEVERKEKERQIRRRIETEEGAGRGARGGVSESAIREIDALLGAAGRKT